MRKGWEMKKLSSVFEIKPPKAEVKDRLSENDVVSFLPMEDLGIFAKSISTTRESKLKDVYSGYTYFANNDVLLAKITPCFENGKIGIAKNLKNGIGFGSSEYIVFREKGEVLPEYLYYFLSGVEFRDDGKRNMSGAVGHKRVAKEFIENYSIPFPKNISEQKQIVAILDKAFAAIDKAKAIAKQNLRNTRELFDSYLNEIFTKKGEVWEEKRLEEIGCITSSKRIFKSEYVSVGIPFYRTKEIKELANGKKITTELFISTEKYNYLKDKFSVPQIGDILLTAIGTIGEIYVLDNDQPFYFKDGNVLWLKDFKDIDPYYLKYVLMSFVENIKRLSHGAAYNALPIERLNKYAIYLPPLHQQVKIVTQLDSLITQTQQLEKVYQEKIDNLEELKKSILQRAFAGELTANNQAVPA